MTPAVLPPSSEGSGASPPRADASVRLARASEVEAMAALQVRALVALSAPAPDAVPDAGAVAQAWRQAVVRPPTARHRVLVALAGGDVVGLAATAPLADPDAEGGVDGEVVAFHVDPAHRGAGHGSRLLTACADTLRADGFRRAYAWMLAGDEDQIGFFSSAGWAPDGAAQEVADEAPGGGGVRLVRLHTSLDDDPGDPDQLDDPGVRAAETGPSPAEPSA